MNNRISNTFMLLPMLGITISNAQQKAEMPNVIILLTDDQGYGDLSCHGNPSLKTPFIDRMHKESVRLTDFHVAPMSTPTRSQLITGRDCLSNGAFMVCGGYSLLKENIPTMPEIFQKNGYETGIFGKWHLGDNYPCRPQDRGFKEVLSFNGWGITSVADYWNNDYFDDYLIHNGTIKQYKGYCTDVFFSEAMDWMKKCKNQDKPFFVYLPTNAPHGPLYVSDKYRKPYETLGHNLASFFGMIANIDENVGRLDSMLKKEKLYRNTLIIYMTDNGATAGYQYYNAGMRDGKQSYYDGGHRVPCFIRWPEGNLRKPSDVDALTQCQDILPTLIDLCGLQSLPETKFDGISIAPILKGMPQPSLEERILVVQYGRQPWERVRFPEEGDACVMWKKYRLVENSTLYNLSNDPGQQNDIYKQHPEVVGKLQKYYQGWWKTTESQLNIEQRIYIGSERENPVTLSSEDWYLRNTSNNSHIREGVNRSGEWKIKIVQEGDYQISLRRWPKEADAELTVGLPEYIGVDGNFKEGKALPIKYANLRIGKQEYNSVVKPQDKEAVFNCHLKQQETSLMTWFYDENGNQLSGAYYVYISKK